MAKTEQAHDHHYVPRWYQKQFLAPGQAEYFYLDLHPSIVCPDGTTRPKRALRRCGPAGCFYQDDLYTLKLGNWSTDDVEKRFFGVIDNAARDAVAVFADYGGLTKEVPKAIQVLFQYMDAQRFRTPRGLDQLRAMIDVRDRNLTLLAMRDLFLFHSTMWMEGIWEIVRARTTETKFIVTDAPVTFFNRRGFPSELVYPKDVGLEQVGTRTLFPLSLDSCLVITHTQLTRDPWLNPMAKRANARAYAQTMKHLGDIQFGRELAENEVLRINFILKKRAARFIAAAEEDWLYPEKKLSSTDWSKLDDDLFLFPHLYKVPFTTGIMAGSNNGPSWAQDEYGRNPGHPNYNDREQHDREWVTHIDAQREWAKKRRGRSVAHVDNHTREDEVGDSIMQKYLAGEAEAYGR